MTDHTAAREALARIVAIEGVTEGPREWKEDSGGYYRLSPGILITDTPDGTPWGDEIDRANAAHIAACDPTTMRAIAALVDDREAQIAELRDALKALVDRDLAYKGNKIEIDLESHGDCIRAVRDARAALTNTAQSAAAHDARIRAEERERCAKLAGDWVHEKHKHDRPILSSDWQRIAAALRTMGGDGE